MITQSSFINRIKPRLRDNAVRRLDPYRRSGCVLDYERLSGVSCGNNRVFKQLSQSRRNKSYRVVFMLDCSGSMDGSKRGYQAASVHALCYAFKQCGIAVSVYGFSALPYRFRHEDLITADDLLAETVLTGDIRVNVSVYQHDIEFNGGSNDDALCLQMVARETMALPESNKIIIVTSDGAPTHTAVKGQSDPHKALVHIIGQTRSRGLTVLGVGILTDVVRFYGSRFSVSVRELSELYENILALLQPHFIRG